jgi:hypothetical protein
MASALPVPAQREHPGQLAALTRLSLDELGSAAAGIGSIHKAVADRAFGASGGGWGRVSPAWAIHDEVARRVYGGLRHGSSAAGRVAARAVAGYGPISTGPRGAAIVAAIDGLIGDALEREQSALAEPMSIRVDGRAVGADAVAADATPRLAVFTHGLMETEFSWGEDSYGERLRRELGITPVLVRYNSGRRVSQNGASLDELLSELVADWPVEVEQIALVGHSMGGLVARSACHQASLRDAPWVGKVRHVVSLGTPHMGAPLEQSVHYLSAALHALPRDAAVRCVLSPPQRRDPRPAPGLARRRRLARQRSRRAARAGVRGGSAARGRHALLRLGHGHARPSPSGRAAAGRLPGARALGLGPQRHAPPGLPRGGRTAHRRGQPLRAAAPPAGLRAAEDLARIAFSAG